MATKDTNSILIINNNEILNEMIRSVLEEQHYRVILAESISEAKLKLENESFKMILMDMDLKGMNGKEFVESIRRKEDHKNLKEKIPVLVFGGDSIPFQRNYTNLDNVQFLEKPFSNLDLKKKLLSFTGQASVIAENTKLIKKDEYLVTEGGSGQEMFWVLSGSFIITKMNSEDQNVIIGEVKPGELVGEMSFLDDLPRSASVKAKEDSEVLVIPHKKFIDVLDGQPRWFRSLMRTLSQRLRGANQMIARKEIAEDLSKEN